MFRTTTFEADSKYFTEDRGLVICLLFIIKGRFGTTLSRGPKHGAGLPAELPFTADVSCARRSAIMCVSVGFVLFIGVIILSVGRSCFHLFQVDTTCTRVNMGVNSSI